MAEKKSTTVEKQLFRSLIRDKDIMPKALANYMFREVIEEVHAKYNISQEDMVGIGQKSCSRYGLSILLS